MTVTIKDLVRRHFDDWTQLRAWGNTDMTGIELVVRNSSKDYSTGRAHDGAQTRRVIVTATVQDIVDTLGTILHELAHIAAPRVEVHGDVWQRLYATAACEVTGVRVVPGVGNYEVMDRVVNEALAMWWAQSSWSVAWMLIRKQQKAGRP